jgi:uncharacterized membrane protein YhiD involved in acid resistance
MDSGASWFAISAVAALWAILFLLPRLASWRERHHYHSMERRRRRQYADMQRESGAD